MIYNDTYISSRYGNTAVEKILSAFSSIDESVQISITNEEKNKLFVKLIIKLSSFSILHGLDKPKKFINDIFNSSEEEIFNLVNSYLELGNYNKNIQAARELQQEILHFSRIVDLENLDSNQINKRIRNSLYLEDYLKVFAELVTVMRSRLIQKGKKIEKPLAIGTNMINEEINNGIFLNYLNQENSNYLFIIKSSRRREAKDLNYQFNCLLSYLTPLESFYAIINYIIDQDFINDITLSLVTYPLTSNVPIVFNWCLSNNKDYKDYYEFCMSKLPNINMLDPSINKNKYQFDLDNLILINQETKNEFNITLSYYKNGNSINKKLFTLKYFKQEEYDLDHFRQNASKIVKDKLFGKEVRSIESGHIHLDRKIDVDQITGFEIGKVIYETLKENQTSIPLMCPMIDDDHVLIALTPREYEKCMKSIMGTIDYFLIPESSPIIRSIVVELYHRIISSESNKKIKTVGKNLYIQIDDKTTCEIFEDFDNRCDSGCVVFEVALLIYRSNPRIFNDYFNQKFNETNIHDYILYIWNKDLPHDKKTDELIKYYSKFKKYTSPLIRNIEISNMVNKIINNDIVHLNVLEDYYEHQQSKVRKMIRELNLPIELKSLTFNVQTGKVALI